MARSRKVADQMGGGIEFLFKKNKVDYLVGSATLLEPGSIEVVDFESTLERKFKQAGL